MKAVSACAKVLALLSATLVVPTSAQTIAAPDESRSTDAIACPPMPIVSPSRMALIVEPRPHIGKIAPASREDQMNYANWTKIDPYGLCRYREENRSLGRPSARRVVFIGDSITESWKLATPSLFTRDVIDRGVSGQTTVQMLARFRQDVIDLHPAVVHIMGGINDIASPLGTALTRSNIQSMVDLAQANGITVILGEITPSAFFAGAPETKPAPHIVRLNRWLENYAREKRLVLAKYHGGLADRDNGMRDGLSNDGLHPNRLGFDVMTPLAQAAIDTAFAHRAAAPDRRTARKTKNN
ncbi:GDSL-type esterase/lipase family protein [Sphingobium sp. CR2-8]|uniref:GDSL-type esterase/lipase family protein n=1 Tax=Sphingobium sp. CR2-8 TaxID=1306534 RepID=UPI002DB9554B|nr:GDSL-type esterase/lipase family protein [Sphingobium sp. CR2-8]MEC3909237.1 GDSL-type esterase/lipase family protein [Sphingobium sp. CR2-8]